MIKAISTLSSREQAAVALFVERVHQTFPQVRRTILFGSKARGDSHPDSDIDILVIASHEDWRFRHAISRIAAEVSLQHDVLLCPRVIGDERWREMQRHHFTFYENVQTDGVELTPGAWAW